MRPPRLLACLVLASLSLLVAPALAGAAEPPNGNDRCSSAGRNICGTLGVGFHDTYRYGVRWFGDYRGVVPGEAHTFCLDLRFWYPTPAYRYREASAEGLRNRDGEAVPVGRLQRMAYAMWTHGQTSDRVQQAAVMLYVHALMGDGAPGEVDPAAISPEVAARYARIARDADRYHGPYRIDVELPDDLEVGRPVTATVRVRAASGALVPNLRLRLAATGTRGVPASVRTNGAGLARVALTPTRAAGLRLEVRATLASTLPHVFAPSTPAAARNAQRIAAPASQELERAVTATVAQATPTIATVATPDHLLVGEDSTDRTTLGGVAPGYRATIAVRLYGPFRSAGEIACDGAPAWEGTLAVDGPGDYTTPAARLTRPGWYVYQQTLPGDADHAGVVTPCGDPRERVRVEVQPVVVTQVSSTVTAPGSGLTDTVAVSGLAGETVTVHAALYGPFPSATAMSCDVPEVWGGSFTAAGDGTYVTEPVTLAVPGYYTYREWIDASELVRAGATACAEVAETTVVPGTPQVVTQISAQEARPGATITDTVVVSGLGVLTATVQAELWGPYATREAMTCTGTPAWSGSFTANGDGTYTTEPVPLAVAGYYTYREAIAATPANQAAATACGEAAETVLVSAQPTVTTLVSSEVVRPGSRISDEIRVSGLGETSARIEVELFGPFASRAAMRCDGTPFWRGQVTAKGDGTITSPAVRVGKAGFYTYRERLLDAPNVAGTTTECALEVETALSAPAITTGRGDTTREVRGEDVGGQTPTRVRAPGIDAAVSPVIIDAATGALGVPPDIRRTGWWRDGAAPGSRTGAILIAGHLDSARAGLGAFFRLPAIDRGDRVTVTTRSGRAYGYRVTSVRAYRKADLPVNVYSRRGAGRLVLVTCGGPFDPVAGHYRDNIVVTAVPA